MAYAAQHSVFAVVPGNKVPPKRNAAATKPGIARRVYDRLMGWRQQRANRDIADFVERSGGRLTDGLEREMTERFLTGRQNFRR